MMNPANLTQTGLNPAYTAQFNQGKDQIAQSTAQQKGALAQSFANSGATGSSTPNGFQADQMRQLGSSQADQQGQLYSGLMGSQYNNALNNFWNANNIASGNAATGASTSTAAAGNSGSSSASIYGTAGQQTPSTLNSVLGAVGTAGAGVAQGIGTAQAANYANGCPVDGSLILMSDGSHKKVEEIGVGDSVMGMDRRGDEVIGIEPTLQSVCTVATEHKRVTVSISHTFERWNGGYSFALKTLGENLELEDGAGGMIISVIPLLHKRMCRHILLKRSHGYCCDGFWSFE
jgi:Hom_end-associated Hint